MDLVPSEDSKRVYGYIPAFISKGQSFRAHRPETSTPAPSGFYTGAGTRTHAPGSKCIWNCVVCALSSFQHLRVLWLILVRRPLFSVILCSNSSVNFLVRRPFFTSEGVLTCFSVPTLLFYFFGVSTAPWSFWCADHSFQIWECSFSERVGTQIPSSNLNLKVGMEPKVGIHEAWNFWNLEWVKSPP